MALSAQRITGSDITIGDFIMHDNKFVHITAVKLHRDQIEYWGQYTSVDGETLVVRGVGLRSNQYSRLLTTLRCS